ncbi:MAG TPA: hypothetical protein VMV72_10760 [Verrucomicrobiae bacterium]|nr:hypothetical protein [Verrucomicrobiae bacterium]
MNRSALWRGVLLVTAVIVGGAVVARANVLTWTNVNSGNFNDGGNWSTGVAPATGDGTFFTNNTAYTVSFPSAPAVLSSNWFKNGGTVTLDIRAQTWTLAPTSGAPAFIIGYPPASSAPVTVYQASGTLVATNYITATATNTPAFVLGFGSRGSYFLTNGTVATTCAVLGTNLGSNVGLGTLTISGSGVFSNVPNFGTLTVGYGGSSCQLLVTNGGLLATGVAGIGTGSFSSNNVGVVTGNGSIWDLGSNDLRVGFGLITAGNTRSNTLLITSGGAVTNVNRLFIADNGPGYSNNVVVNNGGQLFTYRMIGVGSGQGASNNLFQVGGAGAPVTIGTGPIQVGLGPSAGLNTLIITNGSAVYTTGSGAVSDQSGIGFANGGGALNNLGIVTGAGTTWDLGSNDLRVGFGAGLPSGCATNNTLLIKDGAIVTNVARIYAGDNGPGANNSLILNNGAQLFVDGDIGIGAGAISSNNLFQVGSNGAPVVVYAGKLIAGRCGAGANNNTLIITNGSQVYLTNPNTGSGQGSGIGWGTGDAYNIGTLTGSGSVWDLGSNDFEVGFFSSGSTAVAANTNDMMVVTSGGVLTNVARIFIGDNVPSLNEQLIITNGAKVFCMGEVVVGQSGATTNGSLVVAGGSTLFCVTLHVGNGSPGGGGDSLNANNMALITDPNTVVDCGGGFLRPGQGPGGTCQGETVTIAAGAAVTNVNSVYIADNGANTNCSLIVNNGASLVVAHELMVGAGSGCYSNLLQIGSAGAPASVVVGTFDDGPNSGGVGISSPNTFGGNVDVGGRVGSTFCNMVITNAVLNMGINGNAGTNGAFTIGYGATGVGDATNNTVWVLAGATVNLGDARLQSPGVNGTMIINSGGIVTNAGEIIWGNGPEAVGNVLIVTNGGKLFTGAPSVTSAINSYWEVGRGGGTSNTMVVAGNGATWDAGGATNVAIGDQACTNDVLQVSSGGIVTNVGFLWVGPNGAATTNNILAITGGKVAAGGMRAIAGNPIVFNAGTLNTGGTTVDAGSGTLTVGDGVDAASLELAAGGTGFHAFNDGLVINNNATLRGVGSIIGTLTVNGALSPGFSIGTIVASNDVVLGNLSIMAWDLGSPGTCDRLEGHGNLTLGGIVNLSDAGGFGIGDYTLITYTGTLVNNGLLVGTKPNPSLTYTIDTSVAGSVILHVTGVTDSYTAWKAHYFPGGGASAAGTADPDGDGMNNTNEFLAGFNPTNSTANLHIISVAKTNTADVKVTYLGASGDSTWSPGVASRTNVLEFTTGTANGSYTNNFVSTGQTNILSGGTGLGAVTNMVDSGGATNKPSRFYRVRVLLP